MNQRRLPWQHRRAGLLSLAVLALLVAGAQDVEAQARLSYTRGQNVSP